MKTQNIGKSLAGILAAATLTGCATPFVNFEEYPTGFEFSSSIFKKEGHEIKTISPKVKEIPQVDRSNVVSRIESAMAEYKPETRDDLDLHFYPRAQMQIPLRDSKDPANFNYADIPFNQKFKGSSVNTLLEGKLMSSTNANEYAETIHKQVFLTYFNQISEKERQKLRDNYSSLRPSAEATVAAKQAGDWNCHIAERYAGIVMGTIKPIASDKPLVEIFDTYKKAVTNAVTGKFASTNVPNATIEKAYEDYKQRNK